MATLNDLRTKGGVIVTVVIALGLIAFLLGDLFSNGSIFTSRANRVGKIAGNNIEYQVYANQTENVKNIYSQLWGTTAFDAQQYDMIYNEAWNDLLMNNSYKPSFEKMGLIISDAEMVDMIQGAYVSPVIRSFFADPATGVYSPEVLKGFLSQVESNEAAYNIWNYIKRRVAEQRLVQNYTTLVGAGFVANDAEVKASVEAANTAANVKIVVKPYYTIADSLVAPVKDAAIKKYYKEHKELYRQSTSREVDYVVFNVEPSEADYAEAKEAVEALAEEFKAAENVMQFAVANSYERPDSRYYSREQIPAAYKELAFGKEKFIAPKLNGTTYTMSRVADVRNMPDSLEARHILFSFDQKELADSVAKALRGGASFAELAEKYSLDQASAVDGGKLGRFAPEQMVPEFSDALIAANVKQIVTVESQFGIHVAQATWKSKPVRKAQIATVTYDVVAGDATIQAAMNEANAFIAAAAKSDFAGAVSELGLSKRTARIGNTDRNVNGLNEARELIRWAYNNKAGKVSGAMEIDGDFVVATVKTIREEGYMLVKEVAARIAQELRNEEKAAWVAEQVAGLTTIEEVAEKLGVEVTTAEEVYGNANNIAGVGPDMALVGAIAAAEEGVVAGPVEGNYGVYLFTVEGRTTADNATVESEKVRLDSSSLFYINERIDQALVEGSEIVDNRVKFF